MTYTVVVVDCDWSNCAYQI